jgi:TolA-binding protein
VRVLPSTRARVVEVGRRGARLRLEDGRAHVQVAHRPGADWQIQAGDFTIHVHGTAFLVAWNPSQSRLDVAMESGVVSVDGPGAGETLLLRAGESLSALSSGSRVVTRAQAKVASRVPADGDLNAGRGAVAVRPAQEPNADLNAPVEGPLPTAPMPRRLPGAAAPWSERLADGEAAAILAEAQRRGIAGVLAGASSEDLAALADAARFRKQDQLARRVLLAQRRRFPGTLRAEEALFLLGRLADDAGGRASDAFAWYERYLRDAPSGAYAAEAMGRMMLALDRQQRTEQARVLAAEYLRRFPQGAYARSARQMAATDR